MPIMNTFGQKMKEEFAFLAVDTLKVYFTVTIFSKDIVTLAQKVNNSI